jgi:8-oxo-dGTP diphosphatase
MMDRAHRISAGAIVIHQDRVLLVRYDKGGQNYLVAPGGGVEGEEALPQAVVREVREETGLEVSPGKVLFVEDLCWQKYRVVKAWFLCTLVGGRLERTQGAIEEGITSAKWYTKDELKDVTVYPSPLKDTDWELFSRGDWATKYLGLSYADF